MAGKLGDAGEQGVTETLHPNRPVIEISGANWVSDPPMVQARSAWGDVLKWGVVVFVVWKLVK